MVYRTVQYRAEHHHTMQMHVVPYVLLRSPGGMRYTYGYTVWMPASSDTDEGVTFRHAAAVKRRDMWHSSIPIMKQDPRVSTNKRYTIRDYCSVCLSLRSTRVLPCSVHGVAGSIYL